MEVLIPSVKPFELLPPRRPTVSMRNKSCPVVWPRVLDTEWLPWEEFLFVCSCLEPCSDSGCDATMWAGYCEMRKATDL
jgi:hypothetical protein